MESEVWSAVDAFVTETITPQDAALDAALRDSEKAGLPAIQITPPQGKLLYLLARLVAATTVLEFGTLGGYSTIWLARALSPGGRLISLEANPDYAEVARVNIERAGVADRVEVRVGPALEQLPQLAEENAGPFDLSFIDADKVNTPNYFAWALEHSSPGSLIVADNVVRAGSLANAASNDRTIEAQRELHTTLATDSRVSATTIQTVGSKGHDGFTLALVN